MTDTQDMTTTTTTTDTNTGRTITWEIIDVRPVTDFPNIARNAAGRWTHMLGLRRANGRKLFTAWANMANGEVVSMSAPAGLGF